MDLFKPSKKIINLITSGKDKLDIYYEIIERNKEEYWGNKNVDELVEKISKKYNFDRKNIKWQSVTMPYYEAAKNCVAHSNKDLESFVVSHYIGDLGVCFGFKDEGEYFKNKEIKHQYENKIPITNFNKNPNIPCRGNGTKRIFEYSDFIEVDSKNGILYIGKTKDSIINPRYNPEF